jgi:predicted HTH domain antitoxin
MKIEIDIPETTMSALKRAPRELPDYLLLTAAVKLYEMGSLSQERAAELAGQSRQAFLSSLSSFGVSPFQGFDEDMEIVRSI